MLFTFIKYSLHGRAGCLKGHAESGDLKPDDLIVIVTLLCLLHKRKITTLKDTKSEAMAIEDDR